MTEGCSSCLATEFSTHSLSSQKLAHIISEVTTLSLLGMHCITMSLEATLVPTLHQEQMLHFRATNANIGNLRACI